MLSALIPGSFDPITKGHTEMILRSAMIFDRVYVAVAQNDAKRYLFSMQERVNMCARVFDRYDNVEVVACTGLVSSLCESLGAVIVKGIRDSDDYVYENRMAHANFSINGSETLFIPSSPELSHVSSSMVREIASNGGDIRQYVPEEIYDKVIIKFR